jgi:AcrR family transcriptional regulator
MSAPVHALHPTEQRLLESAERLFARQGVRDTTLRQITTEAEANLAAVNYHFGSKTGLVAAVFQRRLEPMNAERLVRLDAVLERCGSSRPPLREVLEALLGPALTMGRSGEGRSFFELIARAHISPDPELRALVVDQFKAVVERFRSALRRALPDVPDEELFWRVFFVIGSMCHAVLNTPILTEISGGRCTADDEQALLERLLDFAVAGLSGGRAER